MSEEAPPRNFAPESEKGEKVLEEEEVIPQRQAYAEEDKPRDLEDPHDDENLVIGGHHDNSVPDISDEEIHHPTEPNDPGTVAHVANYEATKAEKEKKAAEEAAKYAAEHPEE